LSQAVLPRNFSSKTQKIEEKGYLKIKVLLVKQSILNPSWKIIESKIQ